jgi:flagellar export protein FliJ
MAFEFRLKKVLKYRSRIVEKNTREVAEANRVVVGITEKLNRLAQDIHRLLSENLTEIDRPLNVDALISRSGWLNHMEGLQAEAEGELRLAQDELAQRRDVLTQSWRDLEVLERLREKQKSQWLDDQRKLENKDLDEIGQIRADRMQREKVSGL